MLHGLVLRKPFGRLSGWEKKQVGGGVPSASYPITLVDKDLLKIAIAICFGIHPLTASVLRDWTLRPYQLSLPDGDVAHVDIFLRHVYRAELLGQVPGLFDQQRVDTVFETLQPEVAVTIAFGLILLAGLVVRRRDGGPFGRPIRLSIEQCARDGHLGQADVVPPRLPLP